MASRKKTPDVLGSLLGEKPETNQTVTIKTEYHNTGKPESQHASKPAQQKTSKPEKQKLIQERDEAIKTKVTYYISQDALESLDNAWFKLRKMTPPAERGKISKSMIVEIAIETISEEFKAKGEKSKLPEIFGIYA